MPHTGVIEQAVYARIQQQVATFRAPMQTDAFHAEAENPYLDPENYDENGEAWEEYDEDYEAVDSFGKAPAGKGKGKGKNGKGKGGKDKGKGKGADAGQKGKSKGTNTWSGGKGGNGDKCNICNRAGH